jgi:ATP-binding cassette, subfamily B, bacterial
MSRENRLPGHDPTETQCDRRQENVLADRMYEVVHAKSTELDLEYYENSRYYDTLHRAQQEAPLRPARVLANLRNVIQSCISTLAVGALLVWLHWAIVFVLLAAASPGALVRLKFAKKLHLWGRERTPTERQASYLNSMLTSDAYAKEIRLFDLASLFIDRFRGLRTQIRREKVAIGTKRTLAELLTLCAAICVSFGLLAYLALRTIQGSMTLGDLIMFYAAVQRGQTLLRQVFYSLTNLYEDNLFLSNLYEFLDLKPKLNESSNPKPVQRPLKGAIVFDHVSFQYPEDDKRVLEDINLTIRPG